MSGIMNIGIRSLLAYQYALSITSQNIANANTPFYSRRVVDFLESGTGSIGNGVMVGDVRRIYDETASRNLMKGTSDFAKADFLLQNMLSFEGLFDEKSTSIASFINDSLATLQQLNVIPSNIQNRSLFLSRLNNIATQFHNLHAEIQKQRDNVNTSLQTDVSQINDITQQLADINNRIASMPEYARGELLDQREKLVQQLATYMDFTTISTDNDGLDIFLSNGTPLVSGTQAATLTTQANPENASELLLAIKFGSQQTPITDFIQSGEIAGLLNYRSNALNTAENSLGRLALTISQMFNEQNQLGIDINGNLGTNIFNDINDPSLTAGRVIANTNNSGSAVMNVNINNLTLLTTSDYRLEFDSSSHYVLKRLSDNSVVTQGNVGSTFPQTISADGFSIQISSGNFNSNDRYLISPTHNAANAIQVNLQDPSKLALASPAEVAADPANIGDGKINLQSITDTTTSDFSIPKQLNPPIRIEFITATSYRLVNSNNGNLIEGPITYDPNTTTSLFPTPNNYDPGYRVTLFGNVQAGDKFTINYNNNSAGDNRNGLVMASLYEKGILDGGTNNFVGGYNHIAGDVSLKTKTAKIAYDSSEVIKTQAENQWDNISGVSIEEEKLKLTQYQESYQASAQILETLKTVFDVIVNLSR